jgi:plastocyanin
MRRLGLALLCLLAVGCAMGSAAAPALTPAEAETAPEDVTLYISSERSVFDRDRLTVPADTPFAIRYENLDRVPHNVAIRGGSTPLVGEIFSGPAERVYHFPPLAAGTYRFLCDVHPEMAGTFEVTD